MDLTVYTQDYPCKTADRQQEIDECLRRNLIHPGIRKMALFKESNAPPLPEATIELGVVESIERVTYAEWIRWVQRRASGIGLLLNADIDLDECLGHLAETFDAPEALQALTRYKPGHASFCTNDYTHFAQDVCDVRELEHCSRQKGSCSAICWGIGTARLGRRNTKKLAKACSGEAYFTTRHTYGGIGRSKIRDKINHESSMPGKNLFAED